MWDLFETWLDSSSKPVKYKNNQTHYATWCKGCFDRFEVKHAADILNIDEGNLQCDQVQSTDHWQDVGWCLSNKCSGYAHQSSVLGKNIGLAIHAASWKSSSNIFETSGVIPIARKITTAM